MSSLLSHSDFGDLRDSKTPSLAVKSLLLYFTNIIFKLSNLINVSTFLLYGARTLLIAFELDMSLCARKSNNPREFFLEIKMVQFYLLHPSSSMHNVTICSEITKDWIECIFRIEKPFRFRVRCRRWGKFKSRS